LRDHLLRFACVRPRGECKFVQGRFSHVGYDDALCRIRQRNPLRQVEIFGFARRGWDVRVDFEQVLSCKRSANMSSICSASGAVRLGTIVGKSALCSSTRRCTAEIRGSGETGYARRFLFLADRDARRDRHSASRNSWCKPRLPAAAQVTLPPQTPARHNRPELATTPRNRHMKNLRLRLLLPASILLLAIAGFVVLVETKPVTPAVTSEEKSWSVSVERAQPGHMEPVIRLLGRVESPRVARLVAGIDADVVEVPAQEGLSVEEGELLVRLDEREARLLFAQREAELAEVEAQISSEQERHRSNVAALEHEKKLLELARRGVKRASDLAASRVGAQAALDEARQAMERQALALNNLDFSIQEHGARLGQLEARRRRAEALRDDAALDLERTRIVAPFRGRIAQVQVAPGDRVRTGGSLLEVFDRDAMEVRAQIPSRYLRVIREAVEGGFALRARSSSEDGAVEAELDRLAAQVERGSGGIDGLFRIMNGHDHLALGRSLQLRLHLPAQQDVVAVPFEALYGTDRVYKVVDARMVGVPVERIGEVYGEGGSIRALIRSSKIAAGEPIVVIQLPRAMDGLKVRTEEILPPDSVAQVADPPSTSAGAVRRGGM
jgi:HlyD family secretion protein